MARARMSSVRGIPLFGLPTALGLSQRAQVTDSGGVDHDHLAGPLEPHKATGRELRGDGRERLFDDDRVVLRENDAGFLCHGTRLTPRHPGMRRGDRPQRASRAAASLNAENYINVEPLDPSTLVRHPCA